MGVWEGKLSHEIKWGVQAPTGSASKMMTTNGNKREKVVIFEQYA